jgi:hypothetical protein
MKYIQSTKRQSAVMSRVLGLLTIFVAALLPTTSDALRGGKVITGFSGVVEFRYNYLVPAQPYGVETKSTSCTGSMIAPNVVLTAAHCLDHAGANGNPRGTHTFRIFYHDPQQGRNQVFSGTATWAVSPSYRSFGDNPDYAGDANADHGVIMISRPVSGMDRFTNTDYHDYLRIYSDKKGFLDDTNLDLYGAGMHAYSGSSDDKLRTHWFHVENVEYNHIVVDTRDKVSTCKGDSGGPFIYKGKASGQEVPMIAGVNSGMETGEPWFEGDYCAHNDPPHDDAFASRISWKVIRFIRERTGISCSAHSNASKEYVRCFDLPFIEDIEYEGLDRDLAVAIAVSSII